MRGDGLMRAAHDEGRVVGRDSTVATIVVEAQAQRVTEILSADGVAHALFKGPWLGELWRRDKRVRTFGDVDVLINAIDRSRVVDILASSAINIGPASHLPDDVMVGAGPSGAVVDVQSHVLHEPELQACFNVDVSGMLSRSRQVTLSGSSIPMAVLDPLDNLITVSLHALRWDPLSVRAACDVHTCLTHDDIDWAALVPRARDTRTGLVLAMMIDRAHALFGSPVPKEMVRDLAPLAGWRGVLRLAAHIRPSAQLGGRRGSAGRAFTSTRQNTRESAKALARALR